MLGVLGRRAPARLAETLAVHLPPQRGSKAGAEPVVVGAVEVEAAGAGGLVLPRHDAILP